MSGFIHAVCHISDSMGEHQKRQGYRRCLGYLLCQGGVTACQITRPQMFTPAWLSLRRITHQVGKPEPVGTLFQPTC